jgi:hypothetical protein
MSALKATLEGKRKGHAIVLKELRSQLQEALAENSRLEHKRARRCALAIDTPTSEAIDHAGA